MKSQDYPEKSRHWRAREKGSSKPLWLKQEWLGRPMEQNRKSRNRPKCLRKFSLL